jgi:hypothetical protein
MNKIVVTFFDDWAARTKREEELDLSELAARIREAHAPVKAQLPWLKLARFGDRRTSKGCLRHDDNVIAITGVELDYDAGAMPFDRAVEIAEKAGLRALIYASPSYTAAEPRWRILCPLSCELPPGRRGHLVGRVNGLFGGIFAAESWTLSQSYYYGYVDGAAPPGVANT